jgi:hypothetical protein
MGPCCGRGMHVSPFISEYVQTMVDHTFGQLKEVDETSGIALLASLNSICLLPGAHIYDFLTWIISLIRNTATPTDLKSLDLYAHLSSMPKNSSDDVDGAGDGAPQGGKNKGKNKLQSQTQPSATKRELGRLKNKKALARVVEGSMGREGQGDENADEERMGGEEGRENKRPRSEGGYAQAEETRDAVMDEDWCWIWPKEGKCMRWAKPKIAITLLII